MQRRVLVTGGWAASWGGTSGPSLYFCTSLYFSSLYFCTSDPSLYPTLNPQPYALTPKPQTLNP